VLSDEDIELLAGKFALDYPSIMPTSLVRLIDMVTDYKFNKTVFPSPGKSIAVSCIDNRSYDDIARRLAQIKAEKGSLHE
jgi:hypothetical protein